MHAKESDAQFFEKLACQHCILQQQQSVLSIGYPDVLLSPSLHKVANTTATLRYRLINIKQAELSSLVVLGRIHNSDWSLFTNFSSTMTDAGDIFVTVSKLKPRQKYDFLVRPCNAYGCNPRDPELLSITTLGKTHVTMSKRQLLTRILSHLKGICTVTNKE